MDAVVVLVIVDTTYSRKRVAHEYNNLSRPTKT